MASKVDLRKTLQSGSAAGIRGQLPLRAGQIADLTEAEQRGLGQLNWQPGDPVPGNLLELIAAEQRQLAEEPPAILTNPGSPPVIAPPVRIEDLPPEKQRELAEALRVAKAQAPRVLPSARFTTPAVQQAYELAQGLAARQAQRTDPAPAAEALKPLPPVSAPPKSPPAPEPPPTPADDSKSRTGLEREPNCPHCGWNLEQRPDGVEPDRADKLVFLQAILGGQPFTKTVRLLDGKLGVTFRSLSRKTADLVDSQMRVEVDTQRVKSGTEYFNLANHYRLCMSLVAVEQTGGLVSFPESADDYAVDKDKERPDDTVLPQICEYVAAKALPTEPARHVIGLQFARFQHLLAKLEARIDDANFWRGTESPP